MKIKLKKNEGRVDSYLAKKLKLPRNQIQTMIKQGDVVVNDKPVKASQVLEEKDTIQVKIVPQPEDSRILKSEKMDLDLLYEDPFLLVLNKPMGLVTHPGSGVKSGTLANALIGYTSALSTLAGQDRPGIVHRLDRDTDGLLIIAKDDETHQALSDQFKNRSVEKKYYGVLKGNPPESEFVIDRAIIRHPSQRLKMAVATQKDEKAKEASTSVEVLQRFVTKTLVRLIPMTGRTHQLRVHLSSIGYPILGDPLYLHKKERGKGQLLQAYYLKFFHPQKKIWMSFELPLSKRLI